MNLVFVSMLSVIPSNGQTWFLFNFQNKIQFWIKKSFQRPKISLSYLTVLAINFALTFRCSNPKVDWICFWDSIITTTRFCRWCQIQEKESGILLEYLTHEFCSSTWSHYLPLLDIWKECSIKKDYNE